MFGMLINTWAPDYLDTHGTWVIVSTSISLNSIGDWQLIRFMLVE